MFAADAEPEQSVRDVLLAGELRPPLDSGLHSTDARGVGDNLELCADGVGGGAVGDLEAEHGPEPAHLPGGARVLRVLGKAGVADPADRRVCRQPAGQLAG